MTTTDHRCSAQARERGDRLAGTASTVASFLLVEHDGPWGTDVWNDARWSPPVREGVRAAAAAAKVRPLLIRRHRTHPDHSTPPTPGRRVLAAWTRAEPWLESGRLTDDELTGLDLGSLGAGRSLGLARHDAPVLAVCTHGRHDACCAEQGRPIAHLLNQELPGPTWEVSHIGGDRFAGNLLVLPYGLYYGWLTPDQALHVAHETLAGRVVAEHLRGRSAWPMAVQAAEVALRRELGVRDIRAVTYVDRTGSGADHDVRLAVDGDHYTVSVRATRDAAELLTCRAGRPSPVTGFRPVAIRPG